jgi:diketogulonate reductase-like aldo/keto reductase
VLLTWGLHHGLVVLPKSSRRARLAENLAAIDVKLGADEMAALDALEEGLVTGWDPRKAP